MADNTGLTQLHPGIFSSISSEQTVYETSEGVVTLFQADVFDKGPDNEIGFVSTVDEFIFKYGNPNYAKYGQTAYNIVRWLEAGGQAYVMRVLPTDASYAHSIVNIQTKVETNGKAVKTQSGELVKLNDVTIRPTSAFVQKNNLDLNVLKNELSNDRDGENTVDGYTNNFLMLVHPNGRGESYNNLGFRLTLNTSYDSTYTARVYNFEVIRYDEDSNISVVEGPFYVTFDPDSISDSRDSMFIEDVINKQSQYLNVKFNTTVFNQVAQMINPNVNPVTIDILTGTSRIDLTGKPEVFYSSVTKQNEDVHIALHKYNAIGELVTRNGVPVLNVPDTTDAVQESLISLDNGLRENEFVLNNDKLSYMKEQFPKLRTTEFSSFKLHLSQILELGATDPNKNTAVSGTLLDLITKQLGKDKTDATNTLYKKFVTAYDEAVAAAGEDEEFTEEQYNTVNSYANQITNLIKTSVINQFNQINAAYTLTEHNSPNAQIASKFAQDLKNLNSALNNKDQVSIFAVEHESELFNIQEDVVSYQLGTVAGSQVEGMSLLLSRLEGEIKYIYESLIPVAYGSIEASGLAAEFDETLPASIVSEYNSVLSLLSDIQNGIMLNNAVNRDEIFSTINNTSNRLLAIIKNVNISSTKLNIDHAVSEINSKLLQDAVDFILAIQSMIVVQGTYTVDGVLDNARQQIEIEVSSVNSLSSKFFNTKLIDFENPTKLLLGRDGSFEYNPTGSNTERDEQIKRHLISAYSGKLNSAVLDKELHPFNVVLDARYNTDVKKAIVELARTSRGDFVFLADDASDSFTVSPQDSIDWRQNEFNISSEYTAIFSQDLTYYDEYTGKDIRFTPTYILANKIPRQAVESGLHYPLAGPRRGLIDGFKAISWTPGEAYKEKLYVNKINYIQHTTRTTMFGSQLTTNASSGPLSNLNNMFTILNIKRDMEQLLADYQFEFNDDDSIDSLYAEANNNLTKYTSNRSCQSVTLEINRSEYDIQQRILRVNVEIQFTGIIERIVLNLSASK